MALGAGLKGLLLRCWWRAAAHLAGPDLKAGVWGRLSYEGSILLLAGECLVPAALGMDRGGKCVGEGQGRAFSGSC